MVTPCVFCDLIDQHRYRWHTEHAVAFADAFSLSRGHTLVIPRTHTADLFALPADVRADLWRLVDQVKQQLDDEHAPDGYNLGANIGPAAGQTVDHAHIHVIPRYRGDIDDPRGGVRWVLPARAAYWA